MKRVRSRRTVAAILPSHLHNLILAQLPLSELQRLGDDYYIATYGKDGIGMKIVPNNDVRFSAANCRQVLQLRYNLTSDQLRLWYDPILSWLRPMEAVAKIAAYHCDLGYRQHWHVSLMACLILAIRARDVTIFSYYINFIADFSNLNVTNSIILREIVISRELKLLQLWSKVKYIGKREELHSWLYGLYIPENMVPLLKDCLSNTYTCCWYLSAYSKTDIPQDDTAAHAMRRVQAYLLGLWYSGIRNGDELLKQVKEKVSNSIEDIGYGTRSCIHYLLQVVDLEILPALGAAYQLTIEPGLCYSVTEMVITRKMVQNVPIFRQQVLRYLDDTPARTNLLQYLRVLEGEVSDFPGDCDNGDSVVIQDDFSLSFQYRVASAMGLLKEKRKNLAKVSDGHQTGALTLTEVIYHPEAMQEHYVYNATSIFLAGYRDAKDKQITSIYPTMQLAPVNDTSFACDRLCTSVIETSAILKLIDKAFEGRFQLIDPLWYKRMLDKVDRFDYTLAEITSTTSYWQWMRVENSLGMRQNFTRSWTKYQEREAKARRLLKKFEFD